MASPALYCTVDDVLALVSLDAQARLATDPQVWVPCAAKGDASEDTFDTPFRFATTIDAKVAGAATVVTLSPGTGAENVDQIVFGGSDIPGTGDLITVKADLGAVNAAVITLCIKLASDKVKGAIARYGFDEAVALPDTVLSVLRPPTVFLTRWFLRSRRNMNEYDPIIEEYKSVDRWLLNLATGKIALPAAAPIATATPPLPAPIHEPSQFDSPGSSNLDFMFP